MYNWSTDTKNLKRNKTQYAIWKLEQMVNFGLGGKKIKKADLQKYWSSLRLDPARARFLNFLLNENNTHQKSNSRSAGSRPR